MVQVSATEAKGKLIELIERAEAGEEVILTSPGMVAVRLVPVGLPREGRSRRSLLAAVRFHAAINATAGPSAARSQDFLYRDGGLSL